MVEMGHRYSYILNVTQLLILDVGFNEDENMGTDKATLVNLSNLENTSVIEMQPFFDRLPQTAHADGTYRLRRYSIVKFHHGFLEILPESNFVQSSEVNHFQGMLSGSLMALSVHFWSQTLCMPYANCLLKTQG